MIIAPVLIDFKFSIALIGESGAGKTSIGHFYDTGKCYDISPLTTISLENSYKFISIHSKTVKITLWDTAGQEKYRSLSKVIMNGSKIVVLVYDVTNKKTFEELNFWVKSVEEVLGKDPILGIAANKIDLFEEQVVEKEEGEKYANDIGALFAETSAKEDQKGFQDFIFKLLQKYIEKNGLGKKNIDNGRVTITKDNNKNNNKTNKCGC